MFNLSLIMTGAETDKWNETPESIPTAERGPKVRGQHQNNRSDLFQDPPTEQRPFRSSAVLIRRRRVEVTGAD
ncbi:Hypothetical protein NTJ_01835 [Nesidiocoris tenuis]|uniref:Uncharacterized protein n=1 Tax=Nesidiocoris tenuis TaxID=355587 RepID=A0ABN7AAI2_9HEMI|nr:Hypothetical protein NTJ_01835 [Nesidiocoris tenuis]